MYLIIFNYKRKRVLEKNCFILIIIRNLFVSKFQIDHKHHQDQPVTTNN